MLKLIHTKTKASLMAGLMVLAIVSTATATELHQAARDGDIAKIERLLNAGADPDARDERNRTPLHEVAFLGQTDAIIALINGGANPNARDKDGYTPLHATLFFGHADAITTLIDRGADPQHNE